MGDTMKLTVDVTQAHIDAGVRCICRECPIALALNEQHPRHSGWKVVPGYAWQAFGEEHKLPDAARQWAKDFDNGKPVAPFRFETE